MTEYVVVMYRLREGVTADDYVRWSQETDQQITPGLEPIRRFQVLSVTETIEGADNGTFDVIEVIEVTSADAWKEGNASEYMAQIQEEWPRYADPGTAIVVAATEIPPAASSD